MVLRKSCCLLFIPVPHDFGNLPRNTWACRYGPGPLSAGSAAFMGCLTLPGPRATSCNMRKERLEYVAAMVGPCWRMRMKFLWLVLWFSMLFSKFGRPKCAEKLSFSMKLRLLVCLVFETIIYFDCCYLVLVEIVSG